MNVFEDCESAQHAAIRYHLRSKSKKGAAALSLPALRSCSFKVVYDKFSIH